MPENNENAENREWNHSKHSDDWVRARLKLCSKPDGVDGVDLAHKMNEEHSALVKWGLDNFPQASLKTGSKALDIGCGGGATLKALHTRYPSTSLYGIDYSEDMVKLSTLKLTGTAEITHGTVANLPYSTNEFDLITAVETAYFWPKLELSIGNVYNALKDGSEFIIIHEMYDDKGDSTFKLRNERIAKLSSLTLFTPEGLEEVLTNSGFSDVEYITKPENNWICYRSRKN